MKPQLEIFSVSKYYPKFTGIKPIAQNLTLRAAEALKLKSEQENNYENHFVYAPCLDLTHEKTPFVGHSVSIISGHYVKGMGIIDHDRYDEKGRVKVTLAPSAYCNPDSIATGQTSISVSGGPCPYLPIVNMQRKGNTYQRFWYCRDGRLTGGCSVDYFIQVPLWEYNNTDD